MYIYICNNENIVPCWLLPQWVCGNSAHGHIDYMYNSVYVYIIHNIYVNICIYII